MLNGVTTYYVGAHFEWTGSTSSMIKYYYAGSQRVAMRQGSSTLYFLLGDHQGSTAITANSNGTLYTEQRYHPWGDTSYNSPATTPTAYQFTGQCKDATGLYFYNARFYDPALGRFLSADTIVPSPANPQTLNRYAYTLNNPLKYTDPSGHIAFLATALLGAAAGAVVNIAYQAYCDSRQGQPISIDLAPVMGAAASGAVMGLTMGIGAAVAGTGVIATAATGAVGGLLGGQAGAYTEAATSEVLEHNEWDSARVMQSAYENGFGDGNKMVLDAAVGAGSAVVGLAATRAFQAAGLLPPSGPSTASGRPAYIYEFTPKGQAHLVPDGGRLQIPMSTSDKIYRTVVVSNWEAYRAVGEEAVQTWINHAMQNVAQ